MVQNILGVVLHTMNIYVAPDISSCLLCNHHRFNVRLSALARVGRFPKMPPLQTARSCASSCFSINFFISFQFATHSFQVFLPLPLPLFPSTSIFLHADTQSTAPPRSPRVRTTSISPDALCQTHS